VLLRVRFRVSLVIRNTNFSSESHQTFEDEGYSAIVNQRRQKLGRAIYNSHLIGRDRA